MARLIRRAACFIETTASGKRIDLTLGRGMPAEVTYDRRTYGDALFEAAQGAVHGNYYGMFKVKDK
ncbi:MAG TPA: hypothetical protein VH858_08175 [Hyphomicrobiales bacterium]|jgi:hypothetical protein